MTQERWNTFTRQEQMGHISSEILRANDFRDNKDLVKHCMTTALNLAALTINDNKWKGKRRYLFLVYEELAKMYIGENKNYLQLFRSL